MGENMLFMTPSEAHQRKVRLEFPSGSSSEPTRIWKHPFIDRHLSGHPGYSDFRADLPLQTQSVRVEPGSIDPFPIAYLVQQEPNTVIQAHFHRQNQFQ